MIVKELQVILPQKGDKATTSVLLRKEKQKTVGTHSLPIEYILMVGSCFSHQNFLTMLQKTILKDRTVVDAFKSVLGAVNPVKGIVGKHLIWKTYDLVGFLFCEKNHFVFFWNS